MRSGVDEDLQECVCVHVIYMAILKNALNKKKGNENKSSNAKSPMVYIE